MINFGNGKKIIGTNLELLEKGKNNVVQLITQILLGYVIVVKDNVKIYNHK